MTTATLEKVKQARNELARSGQFGLNAVHRAVGGNKATVKKRLADLIEAGDLPPSPDTDHVLFLPPEVTKRLEAIAKAGEAMAEAFQEAMFARLREERILIDAEWREKKCRHCGKVWSSKEEEESS